VGALEADILRTQQRSLVTVDQGRAGHGMETVVGQ
jgi:hypothetical protein